MSAVNDPLPSADPDRTNLRELSEHTATLDATLDSTRPTLPDAPPGSPTVPGYHITSEIAKGGMGRVYAALDLTLDREVAIKTLLPGANADRFVTESKITAKLPHPNIPPVYELGTLADGTPFLAMKLVRGTTLSEQLKARPSPQHDLPRFVHIFEQIAQAVGLAHSRGVIHRDLKPLNVMVGEFGEVQVMDWGLAKLASGGREAAVSAGEQPPDGGRTPEHDLTHAGAVLGTPGYMAPEQARAELLDARADVFALGATLAAILTGKPAFVGTSVDETIQKAAKAELSDVVTRLDVCGADADLIAVAKRCLSADRDARPADGRGVADEVAAYRAGVQARLRQAETDKAKAETQAAEQRKRRRQFNVAAGIVAAVLLAGIIGTTAGLLIAVDRAGREELAKIAERDAKEAESKAKDEERTAKGLAIEREAKAERAAGKMLHTLDVMVSGVTGKSLATQKTITPEQKEFLTQVLPLYQEFLADKDADQKTRERAASAAFQVGQIEYRLGRSEESLISFHQARVELDRLVAAFPTTPAYRFDLAAAHYNLGMLLSDLGRWDEAEQQFARGLDISEKLVSEFPAEPAYRFGLAGGYSGLSEQLRSRGARTDAEKRARQALLIQERLVTEHPKSTESRSALVQTHDHLGLILGELERWDEAEQEHGRGLALAEQLVTELPGVPAYREAFAHLLRNYGKTLADQKKWRDAEQRFRESVKQYEQLVAEQPSVPGHRYGLGVAMMNLSTVFLGTGDLAEASKWTRAAMTHFERLTDDYPAVVQYRLAAGGTACNFAHTFRDGGRPTEALVWYAKAIRVLTPLADPKSGNAAARLFLRNAHWGRAKTLEMLKKHTDALPDWDKAVELSPGDARVEFRTYRAVAWIRTGKVSEAVTDVTELAKAAELDADEWYDLACVCSLASGKGTGEKQSYANRAVEMLQKAVKVGYKDAAHMREDSDLDPIRERDDFKKLLADLEKKFPPKEKK